MRAGGQVAINGTPAFAIPGRLFRMIQGTFLNQGLGSLLRRAFGADLHQEQAEGRISTSWPWAVLCFVHGTGYELHSLL